MFSLLPNQMPVATGGWPDWLITISIFIIYKSGINNTDVRCPELNSMARST